VRKPLLTLTVCLLLAIAGGARAGEDLTAMTNAERTARGLQPLVTAGDLQSFAQHRAEDMARAGKLWHSEDLGTRISGWRRLGENIGRGPNVSNIQRNFMASPEHRDNILFPQFSEIGVGVADGKGYVYVSVVFREPAAAPAPRPAPTPPPAGPRPAPVARPRVAAAAPKPKPAPAPTPTTTTTPPTTVPPAPTPMAAPEPPPPEPALEIPRAAPLEVAVQPVFQPRPVFENPDFQATNFEGDPVVPQPPAQEPDSPLLPRTATTVLGLIGVFGGVHQARLRWRRGRNPEL
jgi:hypothetical protein